MNNDLPNECSIIIPAYNEADFIKDTITHVQSALKACGVQGEIIVVDNDSKDDTAKIAQALGARVIHEPMRQIARARNTGAKHSTTDQLIFIDADTHLNPVLFKRTMECFAEGNSVGGGTLLELDGGGESAIKFTKMWNRFSQRFKLAAGCYMFCQKWAFEEVGGFNEKVYASEEIWFMKRLRKCGRSRGLDLIIITDAPIVTSARKLEWFSPSTMIFQLSLFFFFPFLCRYKTFCFMWYPRPKATK
jgi:glycosyltransferase involved in cell wall biosynthesis